MTIRFSTGLRNALAGSLGFQGAMNRNYGYVYAGSQPATADASDASYTKLGLITKASAALTKETRASGTYTLSGTTSGSVNTVTVGGQNIIPDGAVPYNTSLAQTASDLCDAINRNGMAEATVSSTAVTIKLRPGAGAITSTIAGTTTGLTGTGSSMSGGVASANSLVLLPPSAGVISKNTDVWSFAGLAVGTAGWFRMFPSDTADSGGLISAAPYYCRMDGSCGLGSGDMQLSSLSVGVGTPHTVDVFTFTVPAA